MANLKEIRSRITSVSSTMQITSAMKMVSAAKLKKAQDAITQMRPYAEKLQEILGSVSATLDVTDNAFSEQRESKNLVIVAVTSNKGLCGGFNNAVIKEVKNMIANDYSDHSISVLPIGKKGTDAFKNTEYNIKGSKLPRHLDELFDDLTFDNVVPAAEKIMEAYLSKYIDKVVIVYNSFKNAATHIVRKEQFLPIAIDEEMSNGSQKTDYLYQPNKADILNEIIPKTLKIQLYKALLDSNAAEHGARMTAMHQATDNAAELKKDLNLQYNKARQASITNEILEIVAGADALSG